MASYQTFRGKGLVAIGGDLNARSGYNGDVIVSADGKRLLDMCREAGLTVVNSMVDICQGDFTRVQDACVNGVNITFKSKGLRQGVAQDFGSSCMSMGCPDAAST